MSSFISLKTAVQKQFSTMKGQQLFKTDVSKDELQHKYLTSFAAGTNEIFRERSEHDCNCCNQFIRSCGSVVTIVNNELVSIWDVQVGGIYQVVVDALASLVKSRHIVGTFVHESKTIGTDNNTELLEDGGSILWEHFYLKIPQKFVVAANEQGSYLGNINSDLQVFRRGMEEIN